MEGQRRQGGSRNGSWAFVQVFVGYLVQKPPELITNVVAKQGDIGIFSTSIAVLQGTTRGPALDFWMPFYGSSFRGLHPKP